MFEQASRLKIRFATPQGLLSVEDLWDLPLTAKGRHAATANLDDIAIALHTKLKNDDVSFVTDVTKPDPKAALAFEIVKHVIKVRLDEKRQAEDAKARVDQKQKILGLMAQKEDAELAGKSLDELRALVAAL
jgi:hypothetical protein